VNRRVLVAVVGALLGIAVLGGIAVLAAGDGDDRRAGALATYAAGSFFLELDGTQVGELNSVKGCAIGGPVVDEKPGTDGITHKHLGGVVYEPCVIEVGASMGSSLYTWIVDMLNRKFPRKNLNIYLVDSSLKVQSSIQLQNALLAKVKLPAADAVAKDPAKIELTIQPETIKHVKGSGQAYSSSQVARKDWFPANFRFTIAGINDTNRVSHVSGLEATAVMGSDPVGEVRDYQQTPPSLRLGHLGVTTAASHSADFDAWLDDFVVKGLNGAANEKTAKLEFLTTDLQTVLFTISFKGVGIFRGGEQSLQAGSESVLRKTFWLYVEEAIFTVGSPATTTTATTTTTTPPPPATTTSPPPPAPTEVAAEGTIQAVAGAELADGEVFTVADGLNLATTFEFDGDGIAKSVAIPIGKEETSAEVVATAIAEAINGVGESLNVSAEANGDTVVLQNDAPGAIGNVPIEETVASEGFAVKGMAGGSGGEQKPGEPGIAPPSGLVAKTGDAEGQVALSWQPREGALAYVILMRKEEGGELLPVTDTRETEITVDGLESGAVHHFVVRAVTEAGQSANSAEASAPAG
jgi:phage tail-like protein